MTEQEHDLDRLIERIGTAPSSAPSAGESVGMDALAVQFGEDSAASLAESFELAAAAAMVASLPAGQQQGMPEHLKQRILASATGNTGGASVTDIASRRPAAPAAPEAPRRNWLGGAGWATAAALLVALLVQPRQEATVPEPSPRSAVELRAEIAALPETITVAWGESEIDAFAGVSGDVVWNNELQRGYLRLVGMPANNPAQQQYQLWIVDPDRDAEPVDGGVFDIVAGVGESLIPIDAKLPVVSPAAFAITAEQPGGVVVSEGPLLVVAAI